jgi:hypothetical protein
MTLHHHPNSSAQRRWKNSNAEPWASLRHTCLRCTDATSVAIAAAGLLIKPLIITIIIFHPRKASSATAEVVDAGLTVVEVAMSSVPAIFSSGAFFSSSESSRMMTLPSQVARGCCG